MIFLLVSGGAVPIGLLYWLLLILWLVFGLWINWPGAGTPNGWRPVASNLLLWVLFALIGLKIFGFPIGG